MANRYAMALNWRQATAEVLLIVVGVSIALAADSWLAGKAEEDRTNRLLDSLEVEWAVEYKRLDAHIDKLEAAKAAIIKVIRANKDILPDLTTEEAASLLSKAWRWSTFKPFDGAHNTLLVDGIQNIDDKTLRLAIASWRNVLAEVVAEQAALRELGTIIGPKISAKIALRTGKLYSHDSEENKHYYGMEKGDFALAAFADDEWVANQLHLLDLLVRYQSQLISVRATLEQNLSLLRERARS